MNDSSDLTTGPRWPAQGTIWRHYSGKRYRVLGHVWLEATDDPAVAYRDAENDLARIWIRSLPDWHSEVNQAGQRFRFEQEATNNGQ